MDATPASVMALDIEQEDELSEATKSYFAKCDEKLGLVPWVLVAYSFNETKLRAFTAMYNDLMLGESELTKAEREMIAVAVSSQNHCHYCLTAHGAGLRQLTGDPQLSEEIAMNYRVAEVTPRQRAMLDFVVKMTNEPDAVGEADRQSLRDAGFDDRTIFDIASIAGFYNMTNRVSTATGMKPNPEYHAMAR